MGSSPNGDLQTWIDWLVRDGELKKGQLTAKDLYTNEFNPYANGTYPEPAAPTDEAGDQMTAPLASSTAVRK